MRRSPFLKRAYRKPPVGDITPDGRAVRHVRRGPDPVTVSSSPLELLLHAFGRRGAAVQLTARPRVRSLPTGLLGMMCGRTKRGNGWVGARNTDPVSLRGRGVHLRKSTGYPNGVPGWREPSRDACRRRRIHVARPRLDPAGAEHRRQSGMSGLGIWGVIAIIIGAVGCSCSSTPCGRAAPRRPLTRRVPITRDARIGAARRLWKDHLGQARSTRSMSPVARFAYPSREPLSSPGQGLWMADLDKRR